MGSITVVGLGPGRFGLITLESWEAMKRAETLVLRTAVHPSAAGLKERGLSFESYDAWYEKAGSFEELYRSIAADLIRRAGAGEEIVYAVPGSPLVAERTVALLREMTEKEAQGKVILSVQPGMSFVEALYASLGIDPIEGLAILDAEEAAHLSDRLTTAALFTQVYSREIASELKLALMEHLPDETEVIYLHNIALPDESVRRILLYELDRQKDIDHLTSVFLPARNFQND